MEKNKKSKKKKNYWLKLLTKVMIIVAIVLIGSLFIKIRAVHTNEMFPSLRDGDLVIATNLMNYSFDDVVMYRVENENREPEIKYGRVMALEGSAVELGEYGDFIVNGSIISTNSFYEDFDIGNLSYPYTVESGHIFILQDYRPELGDSRSYGAIPMENILGKVVFNFRVRGF